MAMDLKRIFPVAFTMMCAMVFIPALFIVMRYTRDPMISYFAGYMSWILLGIPVLLGAVHFVHARWGSPNKYAVMLGALVPSILLLVFSFSNALSARDRANQLFSTDCYAFAEKQHLQLAWEAADEFLAACLKTTVSRTNYSLPVLERAFRIQDCKGYYAARTKHSVEWAYLEYLEENGACSGWCSHRKQLWSVKHSKTSCSVAVSFFYKFHVASRAVSITVLMVITLLATEVLLLTLGPMIRSHGVKW